MNHRSFFGTRRVLRAMIISFVVFAGLGLMFTQVDAGKLWTPMKSYFTGSVSYVATIDGEIDALEAELKSLDAQIAAGTLTQADAQAASDRIMSRLAVINRSADAAEAAEFTPEMKRTINDALDRLSNVLVTYRDSLVVVDEIVEGPFVAAAIDTDKPRLNPLGNRGKGKPAKLTFMFEEVVETVESLVEDVAIETEADAEVTVDEDDMVVESDELEDPIEPILADDSDTEDTDADTDTDVDTGETITDAVDDDISLDEITEEAEVETAL